ncbi:two-component regulator propeller domain-containing protein [Mariniflexile sp. HNIBRBA6329]|uniref:hybrid sensor histidine kinase/response regulator transcription factor n=1 Tax=Mariniflexile sp. HNIBRBA6329 TaxID=3373088 RepID=UPI003745F3F3
MKYLICVYCFTLTFNLFSQNIQIEKLDVSDGLADNSVLDILQDQSGYLWFGTLNGLSKYDGNNFKNYYSIPQDSTSLTNNRMTIIKEDNYGFIWSWSEDSNLQRINPFTNEVIDVRKRLFDNKMSITNFKILRNGDIWVWGRTGFAKIQYLKNKRDIKVTVSSKTLNGFNNKLIRFLEEDSKENIWIGTESGLYKMSKPEKDGSYIKKYYENLKFISFNNFEENVWFGTGLGDIIMHSLKTQTFISAKELNKQLRNSTVWGINQIDYKTLLVISDNGFLVYDFKNNKVEFTDNRDFGVFDTFFRDSFKSIWLIFKNKRGVFRYSVLQNEMVFYDLNASSGAFSGDPDKHQILEDSNKNLWIGIHSRGVFKFDRDNDLFINYKYEEGKRQSISSDIVLKLFEDSSKNLWIGTMYGGINKINLSKENFVWQYPSNNSINSYENEIRTAVEDSYGNLWLGSKGGKIYHYKKDKLVYTFPDDFSGENKEKLKNINIYCLFLDKENNLWAGTKGNGVYILKNVLNINPQNMDIVHLKQPPLNTVYSIQQDKYNNYWIGSHGEGLSLLSNPFGEQKIKVFSDEIVSDFVRYLFFDKDDNLWIGTSDGISFLAENQLNKKEKSFVSIINARKNKNTLSYNSVDHIFQSSDNSIYASTMGGGLNVLDYENLKKRKFSWKCLDTSNGLSSNKVLAAQEDNENHIWISTDHGINKYYPKDNKFEYFFIEKEHGLNYFTEGCVLKLISGNLLFGNYKGFITFNPQLIEKDTSQYPLVLSKFYVNGTQIMPRKSDLISQNIEYEDEVKLSYKQNTIRLDFSVLDFKNPEKILYSYKLENFENNWSTPLASNNVTYQNLPHGNYVFSLKATNSDGVELNKTLNLKIKISPPFFKSPLGYFIEAVFLGTLIFVFLYMYKKQISAKEKVVYTEKLNEKKLIYYTNISHEFKTPLTLISCYVQDIMNDKKGSLLKVKDQVKEIQKSTSYLLNLVEQILDFRKIREEKMKLFLISSNLVEVIKSIQNEFIPLAEKKGIILTFESEEKEIYGYVDIRIIKKVIYNLLSNAIKFTPENKKVEVLLSLESNKTFIKVQVKDEGVGISNEVQEHLFERFNKSENSSGLGLSYVKELIDCYKGTIEFESELNQGTCFTVKLPITKEGFSKDELEEVEITETENTLVNPDINSLKIVDGLDENGKVENEAKANSILIIEDNDELRKYLQKMFDASFNVFTAKNGQEGVALCIEKIPDIVICDLMMPVMDGVETIKIIKDNFNTNHIPIILLTANASEDKKMEVIELGADDYINKPFNVAYLKFKIDVLIAQRKKIINNLSKNPELSLSVMTNSEADKIFVERVKEIVENSMGELNFSLDFIASQLGLSRTVFFKKIKETVGETPHEFISEIQLKKAELLIRETNYTIADIGIICGYNDRRYFAKIFKKKYGKSPKEYQIFQRGLNKKF